jgi:hypothetical protein
MENLLREFMLSIGRTLSRYGIILGHIKLLAKLSELAVDHYLFLSLTTLDNVNVIPSRCWHNVNGVSIGCIELDVNVLVFGYTINEVEVQVDGALKKLGRGR